MDPPPYAPPPYDPNPLTSHLTSHLASLPSLIRSSQQTQHQARLSQDLALLSLVTPAITSLLHTFAASLPPLASLTLVPAAAVPPEWSFTAPSAPGEVHRLERVEVDKETLQLFEEEGEREGGGEVGRSNAWQTEDEFDDWGRWSEDRDGGPSAPPSHLWFADEALATRLARLLQPRPPPVAHAPPPPPPPQQQQPTKTSKLGALFASPAPLEPRRAPRPPQGETSGAERVSMTVRTEEVSFRRENELGLWESRNGYGIVVRVRMR